MPVDSSRPSLRLVDSERYQFVILDCPYDTWGSAFTRDLFGKIVQLKFEGYLMSYPYGTLPVDTSDFIATHQIICEKRGGDLVPVMAYKSISMSRCRIHQLQFPAVSILQSAEAEDHLVEVRKKLDLAARENREISYDGSWTMAPHLRKDKKKSEELKEIMRAISVQYHTYCHVPEIIGFGLPRFKTELYFETIGYHQLKRGDQNLPPVLMRSLQNEPVVLVHLDQFAEGAILLARELQHLWDNRMVIADPEASRRFGVAKKAA